MEEYFENEEKDMNKGGRGSKGNVRHRRREMQKGGRETEIWEDISKGTVTMQED
jgi:hypothetical protein